MFNPSPRPMIFVLTLLQQSTIPGLQCQRTELRDGESEVGRVDQAVQFGRLSSLPVSEPGTTISHCTAYFTQSHEVSHSMLNAGRPDGRADSWSRALTW
jgi:hypothetical protein